MQNADCCCSACSTNDRPGAFAEYITAPYDLLWAVPDSMSLEAASTISMCGLTAAQGVFARLGLPCPFDDQAASSVDSTSDVINVLIYSASTSLGLYAAQMVQLAARSSGRKIRLIGTASPSKHEFLRQEPYKYDVLVDYRDPNWVEKVKEATEGRGVDRAADTISEGETVYKVHDTLNENGMLVVFRAPKGGHYDPTHLRIKPIYNSVWEGLGHEIGYNGTSRRYSSFSCGWLTPVGNENRNHPSRQPQGACVCHKVLQLPEHSRDGRQSEGSAKPRATHARRARENRAGRVCALGRRHGVRAIDEPE